LTLLSWSATSQRWKKISPTSDRKASADVRARAGKPPFCTAVDKVGAAVGKAVGDAVGDGVGGADGDAVGGTDGVAVGNAVGIGEGDVVGE
jgi:hypothetical protein